MPRDFVPCLYREQVLEGRQGQGAFSCDVIELFAFSWIDTQATDVRMGVASHQFTRREPCLVASDGIPKLLLELLRLDVPTQLRAPLFDTFYAAMAALE